MKGFELFAPGGRAGNNMVFKYTGEVRGCKYEKVQENFRVFQLSPFHDKSAAADHKMQNLT